jgi:hypothetical protein
MPRKIDLSQPLSADDIAYLKTRYPLGAVARMVELAGAQAEIEAAVLDAAPDADYADGADEELSELLGDADDVEGAEDLIGGDIDPGDYTVAEVQEILKSNPTVAEAIKAREADGRARASILNFKV